MKKDLKEVAVVEGMMEAEIIKAKLESYHIPCFLKFESAGRLFGITMNGLGEVKIMVPAGHYSEAKKHIGNQSGKRGRD
jgi:hypothetical protein